MGTTLTLSFLMQKGKESGGVQKKPKISEVWEVHKDITLFIALIVARELVPEVQ